MIQPAFPLADHADALAAALSFTPMQAAERVASVRAVRTLSAALAAPGAEPTVAALAAALDGADPALRARVGADWPHLDAGVRRALRAWEDPARQAFARRALAGAGPTLADARAAAETTMPADKARRTLHAIDLFCAAQSTPPDLLPATASALEPLLTRATCETFGVASLKSTRNCVGRVRAAARLVGGARPRSSAAALKALPPVWSAALDAALAPLPAHAHSERAILRRLALAATREGLEPTTLDAEFAARFWAQEQAGHAPSYGDKLRSAALAWNAYAADGAAAPVTPPTGRPARVATLAWADVPAAIRADLDALVAEAAPAPSTDWAALVGVSDEDLALGLGQLAPTPTAAFPPVSAGTVGNWRDYVKRAWQSAQAGAAPNAVRLDELLTPTVFAGVIRLVRAARRARCEGAGQRFDPQAKGRREHSILEGLLSLAIRRGAAPEKIEALREIADKVNPAILGKKLAGGAQKNVYARRQIGPRHAGKLKAFNDTAALRRWFEAPDTLWRRATAPLREGRAVSDDDVALARTALITQLGQRVIPGRRENFCSLRIVGDDPHLTLPAGNGEGMLQIPAAETKTGVGVVVVIDPETAARLKLYRDRFLPVARKLAGAHPDNPHLFPGACVVAKGRIYESGCGFITPSKTNNRFRQHLRRWCGIDLNMHVMRHLAAKVILDEDPSAMALVQVMLGHLWIKTTESYYAEVNKIIAQRRWQALLSAGARKAMAGFRFQVGSGDIFNRRAA